MNQSSKNEKYSNRHKRLSWCTQTQMHIYVQIHTSRNTYIHIYVYICTYERMLTKNKWLYVTILNHIAHVNDRKKETDLKRKLMKILMKIINLFGLKENETDMHKKERVRKKKNELCMERKMKKNKTEKYENDRREGNKENKKRQKQKCRLEIEETKSKKQNRKY